MRHSISLSILSKYLVSFARLIQFIRSLRNATSALVVVLTKLSATAKLFPSAEDEKSTESPLLTLTGGPRNPLDAHDDDDDDESDAAVDDDDEVRRDAPAITSGQFLLRCVLSFVPLAFCVLSFRHYRSLRFSRRLRVSSARRPLDIYIHLSLSPVSLSLLSFPAFFHPKRGRVEYRRTGGNADQDERSRTRECTRTSLSLRLFNELENRRGRV